MFFHLAPLVLLAAPAAAVINLRNTTVTGTLTVPAGETANLDGTITLDAGVIDTYGSLVSSLNTILITGGGEVRLNSPAGNWNYGCCGTNAVTIDSGIEVLGQRGARYASQGTVNRGTFAAVSGGNSTGEFTIFVNHGFTNLGLLEARSGGALQLISVTPANFGTGSVLRVAAGGLARLNAGSSLTSLSQLGTIENQGQIELEGFTLQNAGQTTTLSGGEWALSQSTQILGGTLATTNGAVITIGRLVATTGGQPSVAFQGVTLNDDLSIKSGAALQLSGELTLDSATIRMAGGTSYLRLDPRTQILGTGAILSDSTGTGRIEASGDLVTLPAGVALSAPMGVLSLIRSGGTLPTTFDIAGPILAEGGTISSPALANGTVISRGTVSASSGGRLDINSPWENRGAMLIENQGILDLGGTLNNQGTLTVRNALVYFSSGGITGPGTTSISDSVVLASGNANLADYLAINGANIDRGVINGQLSLGGAAIDVGAGPSGRWTLSDGTLSGGIVNGTSGGEVVPAVPAGAPAKPRGTLIDIELNTNARVPAGATLNVRGALTGTGRLIVDGGTLNLGLQSQGVTDPTILDRIDPLGGAVVIAGPIGTPGSTLRLKAGVDWSVSHVRNNVFIGQRIEGEPGASLRIAGGYGNSPNSTLSQGVTFALPVEIGATGLFVRDGLTLDNATVTIGPGAGNQFSDGRLVFQGDQTLGGVGEVRFNSIPGFPSHPTLPRINRIEILPNSAQPAGLTLGPQITVRTAAGSGYIGGTYFYQLPPTAVPLTNHGTLLAENGHSLTLFTSEFQQWGTLRADGGSKIVVNDSDVTNQGVLESRGGTIQLSGGLTLSEASQLRIELSPSLLGEAPAAITVAGNLTLGGGLTATFAAGATASAGDTFSLLSQAAVGGVSGWFSWVAAPALRDGLYWRVASVGNRVTLNVLSGAPPGDYNSDGVVDAADYTVLRDNLGTALDLPNESATPGVVTLEDLDAWRTHFGDSASPALLAEAVPEPANFFLLVCASLALLAGDRLRRFPD